MSSHSSAFVVGLTAMALGSLLAMGQLFHGNAQISPDASIPAGLVSPTSYVHDMTAILVRYDKARRDGDQLLTARDSDPRLVGDAQWRQSFGQVVIEHQQERQMAESLRVPPDAVPIQQCFAEGLRLTATGESLLAEAFGAEGHRAYYLSAHGNWDLNLGVTKLNRCRGDFTTWQGKTGS